MALIDVHLQYLQGTPVFATKFVDPALKRVYGFKRHKATGLCLFPAFHPFGHHVVSDMQIVVPPDKLSWTPEAVEQKEKLEEVAKLDAQAACVEDFDWHTEPYDHQREAVGRALWNPRFALFLDCGLGKTKTMLDAYRMVRELEPDSKMLVLCPGHLPRVWEREAEVHGGGEIDLLAFVDHNSNTLSPRKRLERYTGKRDPDVLAGTWFVDECPDVLYAPLPRTAPVEMLELEAEYVRACQAGDAKAQSSARGKLRRRAKKFEVELPGPAKKLKPALRPASDYDVVVMSYSLANIKKDDVDLILEHVPYNMILADESHYMRGYKSNRTKGAKKLASKARRRYIMSGTPAQGTPMHLFGQLSFLGKFIPGDWWPYRNRYMVYVERGGINMEVGYKNLHVLNMVTSEVSLRRKAEDCLDLPELRFITRHVDVDDETKALYNELVSKFTASLFSRVIMPSHAADRLNKLMQVLSGFLIDPNIDYELCDDCPFVMECEKNQVQPYTEDCEVEKERPPKTTIRLDQRPRLRHLEGLLGEILESPDNKVIVWCTFREEIDMVEEMLIENDLDYARVDGTTKDKVHEQDRFNNDPDCRVYVAHISTGIGVTLNAANYTVYYGISYSLDHFEQSLKRNHRAGQKRKVTVYFLATPGSIHEFVINALRRKQDVSRTLTDDIQCAMCENWKTCEKNGTRPFEEDCVYDRNARRVVTRPALLT